MMNSIPRTTDGKFMTGFAYSPETMFAPGQIPQNKGKKFPGTGNRESFRPGHAPHNTKFDQAITTRTHKTGKKYKFIRIELGKWEFLQKYNWMAVNGPIPKEKVLACKDGDSLNCDPANWELANRADIAAKNSKQRTQTNKKRVRNSELKGVKTECRYCHNEFVSFYKQKLCSETCRKAHKIELATQFRNERRATRPVVEKKLAKCTCKICTVEFESIRKIHFCSHECRLTIKRESAKAWRQKRVKPITVLPAKPQKQQKLRKVEKPVMIINERRTKSEAVLANNMPALNRNTPTHDGEALKVKKIVSPDLSEMEFKVHDKRMRCTYYFKTKEKYNNYLINNPQ